ncbi:hypothetical protein EBZ39_04530 [bacterium]|nr:hypothetical protein [bacterium]
MADGSADLCVCILFYGADDYCCQLARRILNRPMHELGESNVEFRFGFNAVGDATREAAAAFTDVSDYAVPVVVDSETNIYKYPMMRRLFYDKPLTAPLTMWFDDNSYIDPDVDTETWLSRILAHMDYCSVIGSVYTQGLLGNQGEWIKAQPWFNGKPPVPYVKYAAGGWWVARTEVLQMFDWPSPKIRHYGGDVMFGELLRQHDLQLCHFRDNVMIQANASGVESVAQRRGFDAPPVGFDYETPNVA